MNILTLSIKQKYFDLIKEGKKKDEEREIIPTTEKKYVVLNSEHEITDIINYDAIRFYTGEYKGKRPSLLIEVKSAKLFEVQDESGQPIYFDYKGELNQAINIVYKLGKILEA